MNRNLKSFICETVSGVMVVAGIGLMFRIPGNNFWWSFGSAILIISGLSWYVDCKIKSAKE